MEQTMIEAACLVPPPSCVCNNPSAAAPDVPSARTRVPDLVAKLGTLRDEQSRILFALSNRKVRTLAEAAAVARVALVMPPEQAHALFQRIARYVVRMEAEAPR